MATQRRQASPERLPEPWILTPPQGFLGALGIKSGGKNPGHLTPDLSASFDLGPFYRLGGRSRLAPLATGAAAQNAYTEIVKVPAGHVWLVETMMAGCQVAGAVANFYIWGEIRDELGSIVWATPHSEKVLTGEVTRVFGEVQGGCFACGPGYSLGFFCAAPAAPTAFNGFIAVAGMDVLA